MISTALVAENEPLTDSELRAVSEIWKAINQNRPEVVVGMLNSIKPEQRLPLIVNHRVHNESIVDKAASRFKTTIDKYQKQTGRVTDSIGFKADIAKIGLIYELVIYALNEDPPRKFGHK